MAAVVKRDTHTLTFSLSADLHERLKARAEAEDRSVSQVIRKACREYLATHHDRCGNCGVSVRQGSLHYAETLGRCLIYSVDGAA